MPFVGPLPGQRPPPLVGEILMNPGFYSATVAIIGLALAEPFILRRDPHWAAVKEPGHFDVVCPECAYFMDFSQADIEHLNGWPLDQKEAFRQEMVKEVEADRKLFVRWRRRGDRDRTIIEKVQDHMRVTFQMAVNSEVAAGAPA